jgi:hypothetical protein
MTHHVAAVAGAGLLAIGLLAFNAAVAQETPVTTALSQDHANTSESVPVTSFGQSVSIRGSMALVGVPGFLTTDANGKLVTSGLVEIYEGNASGTQWTRTGSLLAADPSSNSEFGWLLARSGDRLAVASQNAATDLFVLRHGQWAHTDTILSTGQSGVNNRSLVFNGDTLAIGFFDTQPVLTYQVQIYRLTPSGKAHLVQTLTPAAGDTGAFGASLALKKDLLVVGSPGAPPEGVGQVYVYSPQGNHWRLDQTLQSPTGAAGGFGSGVAIAPGHHAILIGAPHEDLVWDGEFVTAEGELYVFQQAHGVWGEIQETRPDVAAFGAFGQVIAAGGGRVAVGAPSATDVFSSAFGPTFFYRWEGNTLVLDNFINNLPAASLDIWRNRIMVGENTEGRFVFLNQADVLTYPAPARKADLDDDAD